MRPTGDSSFPEASVKYLLDQLETRRLTRIIDVGANPLSPPPYKSLLDAGGCEVWGFEPQLEAYEELMEKKTKLETYFPYAVGDGSSIKLNIFRDSGLTSIFQPYKGSFSYLGRSQRNLKLIDQVTMQTKSLDEIQEIDEFDLLKIDIQGGEVAVFEGAREVLKTATSVITEIRFYPIYEGEPMLGGIDCELREQGFFMNKIMFEKRKAIPTSQNHRIRVRVVKSQLLDGDAVYIRDLGRCDEYSDEQLKHLAIIACGVFNSQDVALFCLDRLVDRGVISAKTPKQFVDEMPDQIRITG